MTRGERLHVRTHLVYGLWQGKCQAHTRSDRIKQKHLPCGRSEPWSPSALTGCADCHQLVAVSGAGEGVLIWQRYLRGADLCHRLELSPAIHTSAECERRLTCLETSALALQQSWTSVLTNGLQTHRKSSARTDPNMLLQRNKEERLRNVQRVHCSAVLVSLTY